MAVPAVTMTKDTCKRKYLHVSFKKRNERFYMSKILIVGGGAAGMMASVFLAEQTMKSTSWKKMKLGKKVYITGKGRCNVTNNCDTEDCSRQ